MDVYLPEGIRGDIVGKDKIVHVIGDFTEHPWQMNIECTYSPFFKAYKTTIPVVDGSLFKFVVDDEQVWSSDHEKKFDTELHSYFNIAKFYYYIFESEENKQRKASFTTNTLSLSNPAIRDTILSKPK
jgi:hypothetical protein